MEHIEKISKIINIDKVFLYLFIETIVCLLVIILIERLGVHLLKKTKDTKKEYHYTQRFKLVMRILRILIIIVLWGKYIKSILTLISIISAAFTIALRDLIFNFFCGIYIKLSKPFELEDRIEISEYKGDVINIKTMNFELLEVSNDNKKGQSTGIIIHLPNSIIFSHPLKNYNKGFKYIWDEINVEVPLNCDLVKAKSTLYKIVNSNETINKIPAKLNREINNIANNYRIYYNKIEPTIYTKIEDGHIILQMRYLIHPKKARYIESTIWNNILIAHEKGEIDLYQQ